MYRPSLGKTHKNHQEPLEIWQSRCQTCERNTFTCCYPLGIPVVRGDIGHGYSRLFLCLSSLRSLRSFYINSLQLRLPFAVVPHSPPTLSRSLLTQSSHRILCLPQLLFPSAFWASDLCQFFISHAFDITGPFQPIPHHLLLETFLHANIC